MAKKTKRSNHVAKEKPDENIALEKEKQEEFSKKIAEIEENVEPTGTMYIGHLPHGFYETQIRDYFSQFGHVTKVRLARSKKTGGYKGYGYIQFDNEDVAKIAADTMNNYLMFDKLLQCQYIPEDKLHPAVWKGANKRFVWLNRREKERRKQNMPRSKDQLKKTADKLIAKDTKRKAKLLALGIQYDFPGYAGAIKKEKKLKRASIKEKKATPKSTKKTTKKTPKRKSMNKSQEDA